MTLSEEKPYTLDIALQRIRELEQENERLKREVLKLKQSKSAQGSPDHASTRLRDALRE